MNYLSINIRGAGDEDKARWIRRLSSEAKISFVALQETQMKGMSDNLISRFWGNAPLEYCSVDANGRSGGLVSLWNPCVLRNVATMKQSNFIVVRGYLCGVVDPVNVFNVYAPRTPSQRRRLWDEILSVRNKLSGLFILMGDFNEVRFNHERFNSIFDENAALVFNNFIRVGGLVEYHMAGDKFTYISNDASKLSKIDRVLVCDGFMSRWPYAIFKAMTRELSDHSPLILSCSQVDFGPSPFKLFNYWMEMDGFVEVVNDAVREAATFKYGDKAILDLLKGIKNKVKVWRVKGRQQEAAARELAAQSLDMVEKIAGQRSLSDAEKQSRIKWKERIKRLEIMKCKELRQKAKIDWVKYGDENSTFFTSSST
ncbi:uncharacterized protein LOC110931369 [Helianthus annuus]|uniref:uncharacterized protein LOC110931369 n=1 Tax=Helianthus annuus TaxID=4232 RepID=UPI000B90810A|nr:uncharacterized protein LOC110931369 [Helianthus annuus]